jgi:hypothetical protein
MMDMSLPPSKSGQTRKMALQFSGPNIPHELSWRGGRMRIRIGLSTGEPCEEIE